MTVEEFLVWAGDRDEDERWELIDGVPVKLMVPETRRHGQVKAQVWLAFRQAIETAGMTYVALLDSVGVRIDHRNFRIPDVSVERDHHGSDDGIWTEAPIILVEVVSGSGSKRDERDKLIDYFRMPSVAHYLVVYPRDRLVVHHRRIAERDDLSTLIVSDGNLDLAPPGLHVPIAAFFD